MARLTPEEQAIVDRENENWRKNKALEFAEREKQLKAQMASRESMFSSIEDLSNPNYVSHFDPIDPNVDIKDPSTWTNEFITNNALDDDDFDDMIARRESVTKSTNIKTQQATSEAEQQMTKSNDPKDWTDKQIAQMADGDKELYDDLLEQRQSAISGKEYTRTSGVPNIDPTPAPSTSFADAPDTEILDNSISTRTLSKMDIAMTGLNVMGAVGDYKTARREGHGVVSSAVRAGAKFAIDEALGVWALPVALVKSAPGLAIKGADMLYRENRRMNSAANFQTFGDAQFMDTQQLATMRQSGMEMAKMAQYNLQQTLMGNEATYLHR